MIYILTIPVEPEVAGILTCGGTTFFFYYMISNAFADCKSMTGTVLCFLFFQWGREGEGDGVAGLSSKPSTPHIN